MTTEQLELFKSGLSLCVSLTTLGLGWVVGQRLTFLWNLRQKQRESDLATAQNFHTLYGEFFAIWKRWNHSFRPETGDATTRPDLFVRACAAEGAIESLFVRLAATRDLPPQDVTTLAKFRQAYQTLRETISNQHKLPWDSSEHPEYVAFKRLATAVTLILVSDTASDPAILDRRAKTLYDITSNEYEDNWK
jgi:hypothetical protein